MRQLCKFVKFYRRFPAFTATAVVLLAILYLTLAPHPLPDTDMPLFPHADKAVHAAMFFGLAFVALADLRLCRRRRLEAGVCIAVAVASAALGGGIELLQHAMGMGRGADWFDFAADAIGAFIAFIGWRLSALSVIN